MIEKIKHKNKLFALIVKGKYRSKKGITFFTDNKDIQQFGYMNHKKNYIIKPHLHKSQTRRIIHTSEVILIIKGVLRVDFFSIIPVSKKRVKISFLFELITSLLIGRPIFLEIYPA